MARLACVAFLKDLKAYAHTNFAYCNSNDFESLCELFGKDLNTSKSLGLLVKTNDFVFSMKPDPQEDTIRGGQYIMNKPLRDSSRTILAEQILEKPGDMGCVGTMKLEIMQAIGQASPEIDVLKAAEAFTELNSYVPCKIGQQFVLKIEDIGSYKVKVKEMEAATGDHGDAEFMMIIGETSVSFQSAKGAQFKFTNQQAQPKMLFERGFNFEKFGIGGLDTEFHEIFRDLFLSRMIPAHIAKKTEQKPVRGMLMYGPPGCGKTLIARQLGKAIRAHEPIIVNGPELLDSYVGKSEEKVRELFKPAEDEYAEKGDASMLHIVILDEIDALCKARGSTTSGTGVQDNVVNQFLTKIDGVNTINNILLIGMTNRKDLVDSAILRSGRLELHVEIGLPSEDGRVQILKIHTKALRESGTLGECVHIEELAKRTQNYTGAEIEQLVRKAVSRAYDRYFNLDTMSYSEDVDNLQVTMQDFGPVLDSMVPQFGHSGQALESCFPEGIVDVESFNTSLDAIRTSFNKVKHSPKACIKSLLIGGDRGVGKTGLAAKLAQDSEFPFIRVINPSELSGMDARSRVNKIKQLFADAAKSPLSVVILDGLERLIQYYGPDSFMTLVWDSIQSTIEGPPMGNAKMLIVTTVGRKLLHSNRLDFHCTDEVIIPRITGKDIQEVLINYNISEDVASLIKSRIGSHSFAIRDIINAADSANAFCKHKGISMSTKSFFEACGGVDHFNKSFGISS